MALLLAASLRRRFRQLGLILVAVAVAAATVSALAGFAARARARLGADLVAFGPNLVVRPQVPGPEHLPLAGLDRLRGVPGLETVVALRELTATATLHRGAGGELTVRLAPKADGGRPLVFAGDSLLRLYPHWSLAGRWPGPGEAALGSAAALDRAEGAIGQAGEAPDRAGEAPDQAGEAPDRSEPAAVDRPVTGTLTTGTALDRAVFLPLSDLATLAPDVPDAAGADRFEARADPSRLDAVAAAIEERVEGAEARPLARVSRSDALLTRRISLLLAAVSAVALALALLTVTASTVALVNERRFEVGLFLALGYTARRVALIFAAELLVAACLAGLAGELTGEWAAAGLARHLLGGAGGGGPTWIGIAAAAGAAVAVVGLSMLTVLARVGRVDAARVLRGD